MDLTSMISSLLAAQAGNLQVRVATAVLKSDAAAEKSAVLTLLGGAQPNIASLGNVGAGIVGAGIGGNLNISA